MILLGYPEGNQYDDDIYEDSFYADDEEYEYDEFGGWFKKIKKKITPKRIIKGLLMPHTLMPHNIIKKHVLPKTPLDKLKDKYKGKITGQFENAIGFGKSRPRPRTLVRPSRPIRRGSQPNQRGGGSPTIRYKSSVASNVPTASVRQTVGANQLLNQAPAKGISGQVKMDTKSAEPKKAGIGNSTIAIAVGVLLVGGYLAFGRKAAVPTAPVAPPTV